MSKSFIVVGGRVYLNAALVAEAEVEAEVSSTQADIVKALIDGELVGSNGLKLNLKAGEFSLGDTEGEPEAPAMLAGLSPEFLEAQQKSADLLERRLTRMEKALGLAPLG